VARGWDSKAVEDQIGAAQEERAANRKPELTAEGRERQSRLEGLRLSRARIRRDLDAATDDRYRKLLERTLQHLEAELRATEGHPIE
jgi:hypothetical protein